MTEPRIDRRPTSGAVARAGLPLLTVACLALLAAGCGAGDETAEPRLRAVRHVVVQAADGERSRTLSGTSKSSQESRLSFKVAGTLTQLPVTVGDTLRRGELIARLDASQYELRAESAQAALVQAQAAERNAAAAYERTRGLYANENASKGDLDAARAAAESARAQVRAAEKQLELARLEVSYTELRASADCSVAALHVEVNENVGSGSPVATVSCGDGYEVDLSVPEGLIGDLREDMEAEVRFAALPGRTFAGRVSEVGLTARGGATFPATVTLDAVAGTEGLRSGLAAEVTLRLPASSDTAVRVPLSAVVEGPEGTFVYLAEPAGDGEAVVTRRDVELGDLTETGVEVLVGLEAGDRVITAGTSVIRDGLRVRLDEPSTGDRE